MPGSVSLLINYYFHRLSFYVLCVVQAGCDGKVEDVKRMVTNGVSPDASDYDHRTCLVFFFNFVP